MSDDEEDEEIEVETVTVEMEVDVRIPNDGPFKFDPLGTTFAEGVLQTDDGELEVKSKVSRIRHRDAADVLTEFGRLTHDGQVGVFMNAEDIINAAQDAIEKVDRAEMPPPKDENTDEV